MPVRRRIPLFVLLLAVLLPGAASGQDQLRPPVYFDRIVSVNPLGLILFEYVSVEYEQRATRNTSLGASFSYFNPDDGRYTSFDAKARYYPGDRALDGFSVGGVLGLTSTDDEEEGSGTAIGVGLSVENQWLMGEDERLALTAGGGAKRLFYVSGGEGNTALPFIRLSIGWAF